jgi:hypothetical protein
MTTTFTSERVGTLELERALSLLRGSATHGYPWCLLIESFWYDRAVGVRGVIPLV